MRGRGLFCVLMAVLGGGIAASVSSGAASFGHQHVGTHCVVTEASWGSVVSARTHWRMWNTADADNRLDGYRWQARLIPARPGFNFHRPWEVIEAVDVDRSGVTDMHAVVSTPTLSSNLDWDLQVKLTWDRDDRRDWNVDEVLEFDESACSVS